MRFRLRFVLLVVVLFRLSPPAAAASSPSSSLLTATLRGSTQQQGQVRNESSDTKTVPSAGKQQRLRQEQRRTRRSLTGTTTTELCSNDAALQTIDFQATATGTTLFRGDVIDDSVTFVGGTKISARREYPPSATFTNGMIFDARTTTGGDEDLTNFPFLKNMLIISEDDDSADPDDAVRGGIIRIEFGGLVTLRSIRFVDNESRSTSVVTYDEDGNRIRGFQAPSMGNGGQKVMRVCVSGVKLVEIDMTSSGAIDDVTFLEECSDNDPQLPNCSASTTSPTVTPTRATTSPPSTRPLTDSPTVNPTRLPSKSPFSTNEDCCDPLQQPGMFGNPFCTDGLACCPNGEWSCSIGDGKTFPCGDDLLEDPDGDVCDLPPFPPPPTKPPVPPGEDQCCDPRFEPGFLGNPTCVFGHACCPTTGQWTCATSAEGRFSCGGGELVEDPGGEACEEEDLCCDPRDEPICIEPSGCCPDGTWTCSIGDGRFACGDLPLTSNPGGKICEPQVCPDDIKICEDKAMTAVIRDPLNNCQFAPCPVDPQCCDPTDEPGQFGNPLCFEGHACCPTGEWTCSIGDAKTFPCGGHLLEDPDGEVCDLPPLPPPTEPPTPMTEGCCDPRREPGEFGTPLCADGHFCCPDTGEWSCASGDGEALDCAGPFGEACSLGCARDLRLCPDGSTVARDRDLGCRFPECPPVVCTLDVMECPDGSFVSRDPTNNCEFSPCPQCCDSDDSPVCRNGTAQCCPQDGTWSCPNGDTENYTCAGQVTTGPFGERCEDPVGCPEDAKLCPDGTVLVRDPELDCEFPECPPLVCTDDGKTCPDGTVLARNELCEFDPCPACCDPALEPGQFGNPIGREGYECCLDGQWSTNNIGDGKTFVCGGLQTTGPFGNKCPEFCPTDDVMQCPDGSFVNRDPLLNCEFRECPTLIGCTKDAKICPGGSVVGRDADNDCEFFPCPNCCDPESFPLCLIGTAKCCLDSGTWACPNGDTDEFSCGGELTRGPFGNGCACTEELQSCPDGSSVARDPANNCEFPECPTLICTADVFECPDGTFVSRDPTNNCEFEECPTVFCTADVFECSDGSFVSRDPANNCEFEDCPTIFCTADVFECPDGSFVARDPSNDCAFFPCAACCDLAALPECANEEEAACCLNNEWACPVEGKSGTFLCDGQETTGPFAESCGSSCDDDVRECSDGTTLTRDPKLNCEFPLCPPRLICTADTKSCPDGTGVGRDPNNFCQFFPCPPVICTDDVKECPDGTFLPRNAKCEFDPCPACCDPALEPGQFDNPVGRHGHACCPNGRWTTSNIGDGKTFMCDGKRTTGPFGNRCP